MLKNYFKQKVYEGGGREKGVYGGEGVFQKPFSLNWKFVFIFQLGQLKIFLKKTGE